MQIIIDGHFAKDMVSEIRKNDLKVSNFIANLPQNCSTQLDKNSKK